MIEQNLGLLIAFGLGIVVGQLWQMFAHRHHNRAFKRLMKGLS